MYKSIYYDRKEETVHLIDDERGYISNKYKNFAFRKRFGGVYKTMYGEDLEKTVSFFEKDPNLFEADLPIETKILVDLYKDSDDIAKNISVVIIDIETDSSGGVPNVDIADKTITAISLYQKSLNKYISLILDPDKNIKDINLGSNIVISCETEETLLRKFLKCWIEISPDIVTGWNTSTFDLVYLARRLDIVLGNNSSQQLSPIGICFYNERQNRLVIGCVNCLDYLVLYKKFRFEPRPTYNLDYIGNLEVSCGKIKYVGSLNQLYKEDINKYIEYNIRDVEIVRKIDEKFKFIDLAVGICHIGHVPYEWFNMSSRFIEGAIIIYMRRNGNMIAPNKPIMLKEEDSMELDLDVEDNDDVEIESDENKFRGAYVKEPKPGLYDWVISADINSLYPSCIRTLNISPETYIGKVENWNPEEYVKGNLKEIIIGQTTYTIQDFKDLLSNEKVSVAGNGALFTTKNKGIIPSILDMWFSKRIEYKNLSKKYKDENNLELGSYYDRLQHIQKIFLNSVYGILGLKTGRFYSLDNAEAVTISGQYIIKTTEKVVISYFKDKFNKYNKTCISDSDVVTYIDTDSNYISLYPLMELENIEEERRKEYSIKIANEIISNINRIYKIMSKSFFNVDENKIKIVGENVCQTAFWVAKKRYDLLVVYELDSGKNVYKFKPKGLDLVRSSFPKGFGVFLGEILKMILTKAGNDKINEKILEFEKNLENMNIVDIAKNTSVKFYGKNKKEGKIVNFNPRTRSLFSYIKGTTAQAKSALYYNDFLKRLKLIDKIEPIFSGNKIKWVYLKENPYLIDCLAIKADGTDPQEILEFIKKYIDRKMIYDKELKNKLQDFYNTLGWEFPITNDNNKKVSEYFEF